ncbi:unnamed protein product [Pleuronectes platessa]|uniref:CWH43-like N-terminal domain-containing protein n=1 Tax=Pleuronectes platessa TaxID=8262 RepID=A0A9N7UVD2_PLEPL|nr:unnamed protein product [Pleuronectes platessa]
MRLDQQHQTWIPPSPPSPLLLLRGDVDLIFPYISDTGAKPPESCIFGLMTFISACAGISTIYARYKFVEKLGEEKGARRTGLNRCALVAGMLSCLSMCIVATFQETAVMSVHDLGAMLFFVSGIAYIILQSFISYLTYPFGASCSLYRVRSGIALLAALAFFPAVICASFVKQSTLIRDRDAKDYPFYLASAVCEWVVAFSFILFFLTYIDDFKVFTLHVRTELEES